MTTPFAHVNYLLPAVVDYRAAAMYGGSLVDFLGGLSANELMEGA